MPFITKKGCCGSTLQTTCLIIGIVFLVLNICSVIFGSFYGSFMSYGVSAILYIITSISLIIAAKLPNKYFCIPWFVGFVVGTIWLIMALISALQYTGQQASDSYEQYNPYRQTSEQSAAMVFSTLVYCAFIFLVELALLRYVISFYVELGKSADES